MIDVISVGDVTEDVFVQVKDLQIDCEHGKNVCLLCMRYADKIAAEKVDKLIGGNAGNFAIGARRLGLSSALYAEVGDDIQGKIILDSLKKDNVSTKYFSLTKGTKTNYSVVINHNAERTILVHHEKKVYKKKNLEKAKWLYLTSMGKGSEKLFPFLIRYIKKNNVKIGFNPGTHHLNLGMKGLKNVLKSSSITSLNTEETMLLLKTDKRDFRYLTRKLWETRCEIAIVTDGPKGSYVYDGKNYWYCPIYDVPIIERTGCGDSYTTAFIVAIIYGKSVEEAMKWGTINAASVIQHIGPQEGLLKKNMLLKILNANPDFKARKFDTEEVKTRTKYKPVKFKRF